MSTPSHCPQCGAALPEGTLQGLCPRCVARQAAGILAARATAAAHTILDPQPSNRIRPFGDYELLKEIAHGGMGVVWKTRPVSINRTVAVKMLLAGRFSSPEFVQRFRAEAEAAANLQHPNIVAIHEVGEYEGQQYFSMDYVDGQTLAERARDNPLPPEMAADYVRTIAEAIHYAHRRGILHRYLKPSNVLIDAQDQPHITDFGLAKRLNASQLSTQDTQLTLTGQVLGTPQYMSPEQAQGRREAVTVASDVYSLGALLYFLLTGRAPFAADSLEATLRQVLEAEPVSLRLLNPAVPRDLETVCLKCLEKEPLLRYSSAQDLADELGRFLNDEPIHARPVSAPEKLWRWYRRRPMVASLVVALHVALALGLAGILWQWGRARQSAQEARRAQRETTTNLWESYLAQARANRFGGRPGRRFDSLDALAKAAAIRPSPELRDEAIAAMALFDIRPIKQAWAWTDTPKWMSSVPDTTLERYAIGHTNGEVTVHRMADDAELLRLPAVEPKLAQVFAFNPAGRFLAVFSPKATMRVWGLESRTVAVTARCLDFETG